VELSAVDDDERRAVLNDYIDILVRTHAIDPAHFVSDAGLRMPSGARDVALNMFDRFEATYRRDKQRPEPLIEFGIKWVHTNVPSHRNLARFVTCDSAQFMFEDARVTGLIDLELGYIGDPAHDLANFRLKDTAEPLGDVGGAMLRYEELSGEPLDVDALDFHTVQWSLCVPMSLCGVVQTAPSLPELTQYFGWFHQYALTTLDSLAQILGAPLPAVSLPGVMPTRDAGIYAALPQTIRGLSADDPVALFRRDSTAAIAEYLRMVNAHGAAVEAADLDDLHELIGERPVSWELGDAALERFVLDAGPEHDVELTQLFTRRTLRQLMLLEPILKTGEIKRLAPLRELLGRA
jgi:hypothetical protein